MTTKINLFYDYIIDVRGLSRQFKQQNYQVTSILAHRQLYADPITFWGQNSLVPAKLSLEVFSVCSHEFPSDQQHI